jgi:hypothetical protein
MLDCASFNRMTRLIRRHPADSLFPLARAWARSHLAGIVTLTLDGRPEALYYARARITAPVLNKDVEHNAVLIHGTPEIVLHTLDPDEHLVEIPLVTGRGRRRRRQLAKLWPNFLHQRRTLS